MRIAVFGGSFDPPHIGHALVVSWLSLTDQADRVLLVPVAEHPFGKVLAPFDRRVQWCLALGQAIGPQVAVSEIEASLPQPSYTVRTLQALREQHPQDILRLVLGADLLADLPRWHRWQDIARDFAPIIVGRAGYDGPEGVPSFPEVSSTQVRQRIVAGDPVRSLVPAAVLQQIEASDAVVWSGSGT